MARMLTQLPLPLLPVDAREIAPGAGVADSPDGGGVVWVHGLATFAWDAGDEAARRLAAVQLLQLKAARQTQVAAAFGVIPLTLWRWQKDLAAGGVAALIPDRKGPQRPSPADPAEGGADPGAGRAGDAQGRHRRRGRGIGNIGAQRAARRRRRAGRRGAR